MDKKNFRWIFFSVGVLCLVVSLSANVRVVAEIVDTSGAAIVVAPPASVDTGQEESNTDVLVFAERTSEPLDLDLSVDISVPSTVVWPDDLSIDVFPAGTVVDSYFLHADPVDSDPVAEYSGCVTFDSEVIGLIVLRDSHTVSDPILGAPGTAYGQSANRELELSPTSSVGDEITLSQDRRTVTWLFKTTSQADDVRVVTAPGRALDTLFRRGDANADGDVNLADAVFTLGTLFLGQAAPTCSDAADADDNGEVQLTDAVSTLNHLFLGGGPLPAPGSETCGTDPSRDGLDCRSYSQCD